MTTVKTAAVQLGPIGGATNKGRKIGLLDSIAKVAQSDTITVTNASEIVAALLNDDTTGAPEVPTISSNVITLTSSALGHTSGIIIYR